MSIIILYITFILFSISFGIIQGIIYSKRSFDAFKWDEHIIHLSVRVIVTILICLSYLIGKDNNLNIIKELLFLSATLSCYPFFYDGAYYETRARIDYPDYKFYSNSTTSTAKMEINFPIRVILLILSILSILLIYLL